MLVGTVAASLLLGAGCARRAGVAVPPRAPEQIAAEAWAGTILQARSAVLAARWGEADSVLGAFRARHPGTASSAEAAFWRGLVLLDPANPRGSPREAIALLDAYLAGGDVQPRVLEAGVLRRLAAVGDSLRAAAVPAQRAAAAVVPAGLVPRDSLRVRDEELTRVRAELEQTRAELDRVRRRLAAPAGRIP